MKPLFKFAIDDRSNKAASHLQTEPVGVSADGEFLFEGFKVKQIVSDFPESCVKQQFNTVYNTSDKDITVNRLSSAFIDGISAGFHSHDILIHMCHFCWQGEGQWLSRTPYEMGVYPVSYHAVGRAGKSICSIGSWSTERYYPILVIEDKTAGETWFFEHEGGFSWEIEIGSQGAPGEIELTVDINALNENSTGTSVTLKPGEHFETSTALYGKVSGGFEEAINQLLIHKRLHGKSLELPLVCFNDYMNCLWANPSTDKLLPLIDAAAEAGAEVFCIDDGWFINREGCSIGDWIEDDARFPGYGLSGILKYIADKGMKPGLWFELETYTKASAIKDLAPDAVLYRRENAVEVDRGYLNFECEAVCEYLANRIRHCYGLGMRYMKNDYNHTLGIGCDNFGSSSGYGIIRSARAFISFIDKIQAEMPDLIIENCGSGALRCDNGTLKHFALQSISDQERFYNNPSILWGMTKLMPPEKCGVWAYPYPIIFDKRNDLATVYDDEYRAGMSDGRETIFNMACTLFGVPFLSGHIEKCDSYNFDLIKDAVRVYKEGREFIQTAFPVSLYPQQKLFSEGYSVLALKSESKLRIGIFKYGDADGMLTLNLSDFTEENSSLKEIYPAIDKEPTATLCGGILNFTSQHKITAHVYEIEL